MENIESWERYAIEIKFERGSETPERVFRTTIELIEAFRQFDRELIRSIDSRIEPIILLEDIEAGSLRTWLINRLKSIDDQGIKDLDWKKIVGNYLVRGKYRFINFLEKTTSISSREPLIQLQHELLEDARETDVLYLPAYTPPRIPQILQSIQSVNGALSHMHGSDSAKIITDMGAANFNLSLALSPETIEELVVERTIRNVNELVLKVKKPDYLGESMWEFKFDRRTIACKIHDSRWLTDFHERRVTLHPGDSVRAQVESIDKYDYEAELVGQSWTILEIREIISKPDLRQSTLFEESDDDDV